MSKLPFDVIMYGLIRTDAPISSVSIAMAKEWSRTRRVFYIDRPFSMKDVLTERKNPEFKHRLKPILTGLDPYYEMRSGEMCYTQVTPGMGLPLNGLPDGALYRFLMQYNNRIVLRAVSKIIRDYDVKNYVFFNSFHPMLAPAIPKGFRKQPLLNIYQTLDEMSGEPYIARHGIKAEAHAIKICDLAIGTSTRLCERHAEESGRDVHLVANAADFEMFQNAWSKDVSRPEVFASFQKPIIIYTGHYSDLRMDHELVRKITQTFTGYEIVFVGTYVDSDLQKEGLRDIPNLHFLPSRPIAELPAYLRHSAAAIIPYASNNLTAGIYPLKINEYMAAGIPTVTTAFSKDIEGFREVAYVGDSHDDFLQKLSQAVLETRGSNVAKRMAHAKVNSWTSRIATLEDLIAKELNA